MLSHAAAPFTDWRQLKATCERRLAEGKDDADTWAQLAWAERELGDTAAAHRAADRALGKSARHLRAVLVKADLLDADGAAREANVYYRGVLDIAAAFGQPLPVDLAQGVRRAQIFRERLVAEMTERLRTALEAAGYDETRSERRFTHALDLATGRRRVFPQEPRNFYYPELAAVPFFPRETFPWAEALEARTEAITAELEALLAGDGAFEPYLRSAANVPSRPDYPLIDSLDWGAAYLFREGRETEQAARCPQTMAALAEAPLCRIPGRSPQVMFSELKAGAHILPHTGAVNTRLICHLPLIVPEGCTLRVGGETRSWRPGELLVFDDTIEHEARNTSDQTRVVLIFDIWRPELSEEERGLVTTLLKAMDDFSPGPAWE